ncbi:hypothetical protein SLEP1_g45786 [Rubroshorea leprosula]|uniref:Uncharacterized protein n=1 Tax=Rubroshorea leprosula TaxID=152421 RepID=A0AAV5LLV1_9ROSI|nr:hypothetical protein SLEP1_g45786 [Rubroshorea leprosula]
MLSHNSHNQIYAHSSIEESWKKKMTALLIDQSNENEIGKIEPVACIFRVPESLRQKDHEAYTPQLVALGPYRHLDHNLHQMQNYKIDEGKNFRHKLRNSELTEERTKKLTVELKHKGKDIHESYRGVQFIWYDQLALMMIIDGLFLLAILDEFVHSNEIAGCPTYLRVISSSGKMLPKDAILRDVLMLENQIPWFVLKEILSKTCSESEEYLLDLFLKFCQKISPIKGEWPECPHKSLQHHHVLDLLYQYITFKKESKETKTNQSTKTPAADSAGDPEARNGPLDCSRFSQLRNNMSIFTNIGPIQIFLLILKLFLDILRVFGVSVETMFQEKQVLIPSVYELSKARIKIKPGEGGTRYVKFDGKTKTLYLPKITLNSTSLVVFRNLVMYETMAKPEFLHFRRYAELMGAIVDTVEDLRLLKKFNVLKIDEKYQMSDAEILEIFNGMTGTMRSKDATIDDQIEETNKCYNTYPVVRMKRVLKKYVYSSWKFLAAFATLLLILMMGLQTFCDVYSCPTAFGMAKKA